MDEQQKKAAQQICDILNAHSQTDRSMIMREVFEKYCENCFKNSDNEHWRICSCDPWWDE